MSETYLTPTELSARWGGHIKINTLANWRSDPDGRGPDYIKFGHKVLYPLSAVEAYERANQFNKLRCQARTSGRA